MKITSLQHPLVKHLVKLQNDSRYRQTQKTFVLEGFKPLKEVAKHIKKLLYTASVAQQVTMEVAERIEVTDEILQKISGMKSSEGVLAEVEMLPFVSPVDWKFMVALDGVNDPGNVGTLMRTALAFGWDGLLFLPNCCDPYNEKVLRAARGAHFKLPMAKGTIQDLKSLIQQGYEPLVADIKGKDPGMYMYQRVDKRILVLGNEACGPSSQVVELCQSVSIPMQGEMESLNVSVAGGILLYLMQKGR